MEATLRPRERYLREGSDDVGDVELIALLLGTGAAGRTAGEVAAGLLAGVGGLRGLADAQPLELAAYPGIGPARAIRIHAALGLGARAIRMRPVGEPAIQASEDAFRILGPGFRGLVVEELHALYLDRKSRPLGVRRLSRGSDAYTVVDPRQVLRPAIQLGGSAVILAHNHPSGDVEPSRPDREVTRRVAQAARIVGIRLLDHLVVAGERYASLAALGELPAWADDPTWTA